MKTIGVKRLVNDVLDSLPTPHTEHVIDDVFHAIEHSPEYLQQYDRLCQELGKHVVNTWSGQWIANALEKTGEEQVTSRKSSLIQSYSLLDAPAAPVRRKPKQDEALQMMSDYFRAHRETLPEDIRLHRDAIVELIMAGVAPEAAFSAVQRR